MIDTQCLKEIIDNSGYKMGYIADRCGMTRQSLSKKVDNKSLFNINEVRILCEVLGIEPENRNRIFFA